MRAEHEWMSVRDLIDLHKNKMLVANPEYQRGVVWSSTQKRKLIDSVFRGYPLPLIYLHHIKKNVAGMQREDFEIIDGQQRITSLYEFSEGSFPLFDPLKDDATAKFPAFIKNQPCPWGGKSFSALSAELQNQLLKTELAVAKIQTDEPNDVRDLFVRLQSGLPLNAQEARDAWPGQFTEFILSLGGKPEIARYPGHHFFQGPMGLKPRTDRGKTRQFAAQIAVLFLSRRERGRDFFSDLNAQTINDFYFSHVDFDKTSADAKRLVEILDLLNVLLGSGKRPKLKAHDAIHLVLLVDSLWDGYTRSWEGQLSDALDRFMGELASASAARNSAAPSEFWTRYGQWTRVSSDKGESIARRHSFYVQRMRDYLSPLQPKDSRRAFDELEREVLFFQQRKKCAVCGGQVLWNDAEVHHIAEHSKGGATSLDNAALVHSACHPKGDAATKAFAERYTPAKLRQTLATPGSEGNEEIGYLWRSADGDLFLPQGTELRMRYKGEEHFAAAESKEIIYRGKTYSPAQLANEITNTSRNAWRDFSVRFPGDDEWNLAADLRTEASDEIFETQILDQNER